MLKICTLCNVLYVCLYAVCVHINLLMMDDIMAGGPRELSGEWHSTCYCWFYRLDGECSIRLIYYDLTVLIECLTFLKRIDKLHKIK